MAQRTKRRSYHNSGAATVLSGPVSGSRLRAVETRPPQELGAVRASARRPGHQTGSLWARRRVLLLNSTYEPLTALTLRRALIMLVCEKAGVVEDHPSGVVVHSAAVSIAVPSVIRLRSYVRVPYRARVPLTRAALMCRDRFCCAYCGGRAETVDHVVPRSRGGEHAWENCVACCSACNHRKADRLLVELGWELHRVPLPPRGRHWQLLSTVKELDPCWAQYLGEGAA
jgi:5-methylcytosine-specific restriction endonuclease McrA